MSPACVVVQTPFCGARVHEALVGAETPTAPLIAHRGSFPGTKRFLSNNFTHYFTLMSECYFIFPSRYLFAIGLSRVFSFRWGLPPALGCTPKQPDSLIGRHNGVPTSPWQAGYGAVTLPGAPFQRDLDLPGTFQTA